MLKIALSRILFLTVLALSLAAHGREKEKTVLVYGDSLSAGFGIATSQSWPALLNEKLKTADTDYAVINASISGETTAGGRARFDATLAQFRPTIVILALGANDGLRGLPTVEMKNNLATMIAASRKVGAKVLLIGMRLPPNYGPGYTQSFEAAFRDLAKKNNVKLLPFLLEPIAAEREAFQADGLHPVAAAQPRLLEPIWRALQPLLK
jgi:acyl-CoA thioesterase-1